MKASEIMTQEVFTCQPEQTLNEAARIMWEHDCGAVPIVDSENHVVGMITDRDICMATYSQGLPPLAITIQSVMPSNVHVCRVEDSIETIEEIMMRRQIRRVAVVDSSNRLQGIVSLSDLALAVSHEYKDVAHKPLERMLVAETLATVSEPRKPADDNGESAPDENAEEDALISKKADGRNFKFF